MASNNINIDILINAGQAAKTLKEQRQALKEINDALGDVKHGSGAFELLTEEAQRLTKSMGVLNAKFEDVYGDLQPLTSRMGELEDRMYELALAGKQNTEEFRMLQEEAIRMRRTIIDVDASVDAFAQKGAKLNALVGVVGGITAAFGLAQGAAALFGQEGKAIEETLVKVNSVMLILNSLTEIQRLVTEKNIIVQGILNAVMKANPIFIIVGVITAAVAAWSLYSGKSEEVEKKEKQKADAIKKANEEVQKSREEIAKASTAYVSLIEQLKATNAGSKERADLLKEINSKYGAHLKNLKDETDFQKQLNLAVDEYIKAQIVSFNIKKNEDLITKNLEKQDLLKTELKTLREQLLVQQSVFDLRVKGLKDFNYQNAQEQFGLTGTKNKIAEKEAALKSAQERLTGYGVVIGNLNSQLKEFGLTLDGSADKTDKNTDKVDNMSDAYQKAYEKVKQFNDEQDIQFSSDTASKYLDTINNLMALQKAKYDEEISLINKKYDDEVTAAQDAVSKKSKQDKDYTDYKLKLDAEIKRAQSNRERELKNTTRNFEEEKTEILKEEIQKRKDIIESFTKSLLSTDEFNRYIDLTTKITKVVTKSIEENKDKIRGAKPTNIPDWGDEYSMQVTADFEKSQEIINAIARKNFETIIKSNKEFIKSSIGESEDAMDLLTGFYKSKDDLIKAQVNIINEELKADFEKRKADALAQGKEFKEIFKSFAIEPKDGQIGLADIGEKQLKKLKEVLEKEYDSQKKIIDKAYEDQLFSLYGKFRKGELSEKEYYKQTEESQKAHNDKMLVLDAAYGKASQKQLLDSLKEKRKLTTEELKKMREDIANFTQQAVTSSLNLLNAVYDSSINNRISLIQQESDLRLEAIDKEKQAYLDSTTEMTNAERFKANKLKEFEDKKAAEQKKRDKEVAELQYKGELRKWEFSRVEALVNLANAMLKAAPNPFLLASTGILGVLELATITANKPTPPKFAKGGVLNGPSHSEGGIGTPFGEMEGGEAVINKNSTKMFLPLLSQINEAGGGVSFVNTPKMAGGGITNINNVDTSAIEKVLQKYMDRPIKTYVVSTDISNAQNKDNQINRRTSF